MFYARNCPPGERVLFVVANRGIGGDAVFTDEAVYSSPAGGVWAGFGVDMKYMEKRPLEEISCIEVRTPAWLLLLGMLGVRITFADGRSVFLAPYRLHPWLEYGERFGWPVKHANKWWDRPRLFQFRQLILVVLVMLATFVAGHLLRSVLVH